MAAPDDATRAFIRRLTAASRQGKIRWEPAGPTRFTISTPNGSITVFSQDNDGEHPYEVMVQNRDGVLIGGGHTVPGTHYSSWETEIAELYAAARNTALDVGRTIDNLAQDLGLPPDPDMPF